MIARSLARPLAVLALVSSLVPSVHAKKRAVVLSAPDAVVLPGQPATLRVKLERSGWGLAAKSDPVSGQGIWQADLPGRKVGFYLGAQLLGEVTTDDEGEASLAWTPPGVGEHRIDVRFGGDHKYAKGQDQAMVVAVAGDTPLVILDIDHTLSHTSKKNVLKGSVADLPLEHSPQVVPRLQHKYGVVYVSARATKFLDVTKRWLEHRGFPRRPLFMLNIKDYPTYDEAKYKTDVLGELKGRFPGIWLGVGDKKSDAEAYRAVGLRALILGDAGGVAGAEEVPDWHEVERLLFDPRRESFERLKD